MVDFAKLQATAQRLVKANGGTFTFRAFDATVAVPAKPWDGPTDPRAGGVTTSAQRGVLVEPSSFVRLGLALETDDLIKRSDMVLIVAGATTDLSTFQEVDGIGGVFTIIAVTRLIPDGATTILWFVGLKR